MSDEGRPTAERKKREQKRREEKEASSAVATLCKHDSKKEGEKRKEYDR